MKCEFAGKLNPVITTDAEGRQIVSFTAEKGEESKIRQMLARAFTVHQTGKDRLKITVEAWKAMRSKNANAYAWELLGKLAEKLSKMGANTTKEELYQAHIRASGVFRDVEIMEDAAETLIKSWAMHGIGWLAEKVDFSKTKGFVIVRLYYGSSSYNQKQMARLIDNIVADCKEMEIETMTPSELAKLKSAWEAKDV